MNLTSIITSFTSVTRCAVAVLCAGFFVSLVSAKPVPENLGNGLDKLVESHLIGKTKGVVALAYNGYATEEAAAVAQSAISDSANRIQVRINPSGSVLMNNLVAVLQARFSSVEVTATDAAYRGVGVIEAFVSVDEVPQIANLDGVQSVVLSWKPYLKKRKGAKIHAIAPVTKPAKPGEPAAPAPPSAPNLTVVGTVFDQGVTQHRVDKINQIYNPSAPVNYDGNGMSVGVISDSFNTRTSGSQPSSQMPVFNLPGDPGNPWNTTPVTVLQDFPGGTDEGRGMAEIVYKMAPRAKIAFATADFGEVGFANNIRALAGLTGFTYPGQTFQADVICDDVGYYDEPFYQDGIIGNGIDDVYAAGVSYFSSAANDVGINGYESEVRWVQNDPTNSGGLTFAAGNQALANTNINLAGVPAGLYAGGFHNFNPTPGQSDVAQTVNIGGNNSVPCRFQWDDPYDQATAPDYIFPAVFSQTGTMTTAGTAVVFNIPASLTAGRLYELREFAINGSNMDGIVSIQAPDASFIVNQQDTEIDEKARFFAPVTGSGYTVTITRFSTTFGDFQVDLFDTNGFINLTLTTDLNLLVFNATTGAYISSSSLTANNFATNQPIEMGYTNRPTGATQVQYVFARSNVPAGQGPTHVRYSLGGNGAAGYGPAEYFTYNTVTTTGHPTAAGCNGTAAYSVRRPSIPESFTSPGPATIYFDKMSNRLATPEIRLQPRVAAADQAGTTWSGTTFSGTSAAAPHAAACAALVLQAHGGPGTVLPEQMRSVLQRSAFNHDLDPYLSTGVARANNGGKITIRINSDNESNTGTGLNDATSFSVSYVGPSNLTSLVFNPEGDGAHAGAVTSGQNGLDGAGGNSGNYFSTPSPGLFFNIGAGTGAKAFTFGTSVGLLATDVTATVANLAGTPAPATANWTLNLSFPTGAFTGGKILRFTVGRGLWKGPLSTSVAQYSADLFGGGLFIPENTMVDDGMSFSGTLQDGSTFSGRIRNRYGAGYSALDGFGFINAEAAVSLPLL